MQPDQLCLYLLAAVGFIAIVGILLLFIDNQIANRRFRKRMEQHAEAELALFSALLASVREVAKDQPDQDPPTETTGAES